MNDLAIINARDDLRHVVNLLKALRLIAASPLVGADASDALAEIADVAISSLDIVDSRLVAMSGNNVLTD